ncbi:hypothetical protein AB1Y20_009149 [Prymnesium parvum]|uniref:Uncharacterized protein n=1 Tax=Prymnesium parvum TaxID=97485 RepID=A0AB34K1C2_PRYPA
MLRQGTWQSEAHNLTYGAYYRHTKAFGWAPSRELLAELRRAATTAYDIYQFGVYTGGTMRAIGRRVPHFGRLWGFDSFQGLPEETRGLMLEGKHWNAGGFSTADALGVYNETELLRRVYQVVGRPHTTLIRGYFNESLTEELTRRHHFQPALLVDMDVDLYSSTMDCLNWLLASQLLMPGLSYVRYDDWRREGQSWGEAAAHRHITKRYGLTWRRISMKEYQLLSIGRHAHSKGQAWRRKGRGLHQSL